MTMHLDGEFEVESNEPLRARLFVPEGSTEPRPAISMAHCDAGLREHGLSRSHTLLQTRGPSRALLQLIADALCYDMRSESN